LSLVLAACGPAAPTTPATPTPPTTAPPTTPATPTPEPPQKEPVTPTVEAPKYGGKMSIVIGSDPLNFDPVRIITGQPFVTAYEMGWQGTWERGPAGGYGTGETDWGFGDNDLFALKAGRIFQSWKWTVDAATNEGTLVYQIRDGVRYHVKDTAASRQVAGRAVTADDVVAVIRRATTVGIDGFIWRANIELRSTNVTKTGPKEVTVKVPTSALYNAIIRFGGALYYYPPELITTYGNLQDWKNAVGTGAYMIQEFVPGSLIKQVKNPNYWMKDPVGPGKGNQLPYMDAIHVLIIPDASTRLAALRTGKLDFSQLNRTEALQIKMTTPQLMEKFDTSLHGRGTPLMMRTDKAPFNDIRVRKAMTMAIDFNAILNSLYGGVGQIITWPFSKVKGYEAAYVGLEDSDFPADARELYTYNPTKAKQLLAEAGYPNGFKTSILLTSTATEEIDYYSIIKDMWSKVGIQLDFDLKENAAATAIRNARTHEALATATTGPVAVFTVGNPVAGVQFSNLSMLDDPKINDAMKRARTVALTDQNEAMKIFREEVAKYALAQAYAIPNVIGTYHNFWWPWLKNYSGEVGVGYGQYGNWAAWSWIDQALKKKMGY
ncbi:MAG: ABC transporter substrate-binding protein, partial [Chloroflexota bacterium]